MALDLSLGQASEKFEEMRDYLDKLTEINLALAAEAEKRAVHSFRQAVVTLLAIMVVGIFLMLLQAISEFFKDILRLCGHDIPREVI